MTARNLATIALRILGALWALGSLFSLPGMLVFVRGADAQTQRILMSNGVAQLVWLVVGVLLFLYADRVAGWMFAGGEELSVSATAQQLQQVGFSLLAVYFAVPALAEIAAFLYRMWHSKPDADSSLAYVWQLNPEQLVSAVLQLLVSIAMFFGSKGLSAFWQRLRGRSATQP